MDEAALTTEGAFVSFPRFAFISVDPMEISVKISVVEDRGVNLAAVDLDFSCFRVGE